MEVYSKFLGDFYYVISYDIRGESCYVRAEVKKLGATLASVCYCRQIPEDPETFARNYPFNEESLLRDAKRTLKNLCKAAIENPELITV